MFNTKLEAQHMVFQVLEADGSVSFESEATHNLVLTNAYELMALNKVRNLFDSCVVGTGNTAPAISQTGLVSEVARTTDRPFVDTVNFISAGVYEFQVSRQFSVGVVGQILTEWGFSPVATAGNNLAVRELFRNTSNVPITIILTAGQQLRILYKARITLNTAIQNLTLNVAGVGNRTGKLYILRGTNGNKPNPDLDLFEAVSSGQDVINYQPIMTTRPAISGYTDDLNPNSFPNTNPNTYLANSRTRSLVPPIFGVNDANGQIVGFYLCGGQWRLNPFSSFQTTAGAVFIFDAGQEITKTNLQQFQMPNWSVSW